MILINWFLLSDEKVLMDIFRRFNKTDMLSSFASKIVRMISDQIMFLLEDLISVLQFLSVDI